jgi:hypothetical protein
VRVTRRQTREGALRHAVTGFAHGSASLACVLQRVFWMAA